MKTFLLTSALSIVLAAAVSCSKAIDEAPASTPSTSEASAAMPIQLPISRTPNDTPACWACYTENMRNGYFTSMRDTFCNYTELQVREYERNMFVNDSTMQQKTTCVFSSKHGGT